MDKYIPVLFMYFQSFSGIISPGLYPYIPHKKFYSFNLTFLPNFISSHLIHT